MTKRLTAESDGFSGGSSDRTALRMLRNLGAYSSKVEKGRLRVDGMPRPFMP